MSEQLNEKEIAKLEKIRKRKYNHSKKALKKRKKITRQEYVEHCWKYFISRIFFRFFKHPKKAKLFTCIAMYIIFNIIRMLTLHINIKDFILDFIEQIKTGMFFSSVYFGLMIPALIVGIIISIIFSNIGVRARQKADELGLSYILSYLMEIDAYQRFHHCKLELEYGSFSKAPIVEQANNTYPIEKRPYCLDIFDRETITRLKNMASGLGVLQAYGEEDLLLTKRAVKIINSQLQ